MCEGNATSHTDAGLVEGRYYYTAFARDANGNWSVAAKISSLVDFTPPQTNVLSGPGGQTNDATPGFAFGSSGNPPPGVAPLYSYKVMPSRVTPADVDRFEYWARTSATLGGTTGLDQGLHTYPVKSTDRAGNRRWGTMLSRLRHETCNVWHRIGALTTLTRRKTFLWQM